MIRRGARGAVQINYDDTKAPFHCPHCHQEFFPDDVLCITCGYEFADERHPYALLPIRPAPLLDLAGALTPNEAAAFSARIRELGKALDCELLVCVHPANGRPPEETAWFLANAWELGGVTSTGDAPPIPPTPEGCGAILLAIIKELGLMLVRSVAGIGSGIMSAINRPKPIDLKGLAIFIFPDSQTIVLEPTIPAEGLFDWSRAAAALESITQEPTATALESLLTALPDWRH